MKRRIECIHFDLDSVLYIPNDFLETALLMSIRAMVHTGLRAEPAEALRVLKAIRILDSNSKDHFDRLCRHFNEVDDPFIIAAGVEKYWDCKIGIMTSAPEANRVLSRLHHRYPLTIVSNGPPIKQAGKVVRLGLNHFFSHFDPETNRRRHFFYATDEPMKQKPWPYLWTTAQADIGFDFSRSIMVGDRYWNDILGANRLGMVTVKVNQGAHAEESIEEAFASKADEAMASGFLEPNARGEARRLMRPDYTIDHLRELESVVGTVEETLGPSS